MKKMYIKRKSRRLYTGRKGLFYGKRNTSGIGIIMFVAITLFIAAATYSILNTIRNNKLYTEYMEQADYCYSVGDFNQALTLYTHAAKISPNHNEVKMGILNCYINIDTEDAVDYAREVVKEGVNEELFVSIANAINEFDSGSAYRLLESYVSDKKTIGDSVQALVDSANESPLTPELDILPGTYVKLDSVTFKPQNRFGNSIYYTFNAEEPNQYSKEYRGGFSIEETSDIRVCSFNAKGESSDIAVFSFTVDTSMAEQLRSLIDEATTLKNSVKIGVNAGQCSQQNADKLDKIINEASDLLQQDNVLYMDAENYVDYIQQEMLNFQSNINKNIAKSDISSLVSFGTEVYNAVNRSSIYNDLISELVELNTALVNATNVYNNNGEQADMDNAYYTLHQKLYNVNNKGWRAAYQSVILENGMDYVIYDINFDDIPELIIQQDNMTIFYAYAVSSGKAVKINIDENKKYDLFFSHRNGLLSCVGDSINGEFRLMTYKDNKITLSEPLTEYNDNQTLRTSLKMLEMKNSSEYSKTEDY